MAVAVSVSSDTDRPGFYRREAMPAQIMRDGLTAFFAARCDLPPLSGGHRLSEPEMVGFVSHVWFGFGCGV